MILLYSTAYKMQSVPFLKGGDGNGGEGCHYFDAFVRYVYIDASGLYEKKIDRPGKVTVYPNHSSQAADCS